MTSRLRLATYAQRHDKALRLSTSLHTQLTAAAVAAQLPTNLFISTILELAVVSPIDARALAAFRDPRSEGIVSVKIRLLPSLHEALVRVAKGDATRAPVTVTRLIAFALHSALNRRA